MDYGGDAFYKGGGIRCYDGLDMRRQPISSAAAPPPSPPRSASIAFLVTALPQFSSSLLLLLLLVLSLSFQVVVIEGGSGDALLQQRFRLLPAEHRALAEAPLALTI